MFHTTTARRQQRTLSLSIQPRQVIPEAALSERGPYTREMALHDAFLAVEHNQIELLKILIGPLPTLADQTLFDTLGTEAAKLEELRRAHEFQTEIASIYCDILKGDMQYQQFTESLQQYRKKLKEEQKHMRTQQLACLSDEDIESRVARLQLAIQVLQGEQIGVESTWLSARQKKNAIKKAHHVLRQRLAELDRITEEGLIKKIALTELHMEFQSLAREHFQKSTERLLHHANGFPPQYQGLTYATAVEIAQINLGVNTQDPQGNTLLHHAVQVKNLPLIKYLLARGASPAVANNNGLLPLDYALRQSDVKIVDCFLLHASGISTEDETHVLARLAEPLHENFDNLRLRQSDRAPDPALHSVSGQSHAVKIQLARFKEITEQMFHAFSTHLFQYKEHHIKQQTRGTWAYFKCCIVPGGKRRLADRAHELQLLEKLLDYYRSQGIISLWIYAVNVLKTKANRGLMGQSQLFDPINKIVKNFKYQYPDYDPNQDLRAHREASMEVDERSVSSLAIPAAGLASFRRTMSAGNLSQIRVLGDDLGDTRERATEDHTNSI